ncbi:hypothetical protein [Bacteroides sp. An19]|uniref:hypothetical protein n=1 Tax=Bacteroides sp. An19 TaxID=1965580 RepID=UPI00111E3E9B|nr:hypothetical protein [Bacteroides sp. An19]
MKKRIVWYVLVVLAALAVVANKSRISGYIANVWIELAKKRMINEDALGFRYSKIDFLYDRKRYAYFLFVEDGSAEKESLLSGKADSLLVITCGATSGWLKESGADTLSLPRSAFDFLVEGDCSMQLYKVISVTERMDGNLYRLNKIE